MAPVTSSQSITGAPTGGYRIVLGDPPSGGRGATGLYVETLLLPLVTEPDGYMHSEAIEGRHLLRARAAPGVSSTVEPEADRSTGTSRSASDRLTDRGDGSTHVGNARASSDLLEQGHENPFRPTHISHSHAVLVLADAADEPVPVHGQLIDDRLEVADLERHVAQA